MAIKSVSAWPQSRPQCQKMMDWAQKRMEGLGITCEQIDIGMQTLPDGSTLKLPNVIFGVLGNVSVMTYFISYYEKNFFIILIENLNFVMYCLFAVE